MGRQGARVKALLSGLTVPMAVVYLVISIANLLLWGHGDLNHTVRSSYAYLHGHVFDFYDYNTTVPGIKGNDYYPTIYVLFAIWMAPVKLFHPHPHSDLSISSIELGWARLGLLLVFWATFYVVGLIAKELFPGRERVQTTVRLAYLFSPVAIFTFNVFGQYDVVGVFFTVLGFLSYLRGHKWRFALFFGLAITMKFFAAGIFAPLLLLGYKHVRDMVAIAAVAVAPLLVEVLVYLSNDAFRDHTLHSLATQKTTGVETQAIGELLIVLYLAGLWFLWRFRPASREQFQMLAVYSCAIAYSFLFLAIAWHPQWLIIIAPFFALSIGYLRRPGWFLLWETVGFLTYIWIVVTSFPRNVDNTMAQGGVLHELFGSPLLLMGDFYTRQENVFRIVQIGFVAYLVSPAIALAYDRFLRRNRDSGDQAEPPVPRAAVWVRLVTVPVLWTLPAILGYVVPTGLADRINSTASLQRLDRLDPCGDSLDSVVGDLTDGTVVTQQFGNLFDSIGGMALPVGTYSQTEVGGIVSMELTAEDGAVLARASEDASKLHGDGYLYFTFDPVRGRKHQVLTASFTVRAAGVAHPVGLEYSSTDCWGSASGTFDGRPLEGDVVLVVYGRY